MWLSTSCILGHKHPWKSNAGFLQKNVYGPIFQAILEISLIPWNPTVNSRYHQTKN